VVKKKKNQKSVVSLATTNELSTTVISILEELMLKTDTELNNRINIPQVITAERLEKYLQIVDD
jgi:hypothetical protein